MEPPLFWDILTLTICSFSLLFNILPGLWRRRNLPYNMERFCVGRCFGVITKNSAAVARPKSFYLFYINNSCSFSAYAFRSVFLF